METLILADTCICCNGNDLTRSPAILMPFVAKRVFWHDPLEITPAWGLRDLKQGIAYTICNSLQCQDCGALFLDYRFSEAQMTRLYTGYRDADYNSEREAFEPGYMTTAALDFNHRHAYITDVERWLAPHLPAHPRILDWGGAEGTNTPFLEQAHISILDISGVATVPGAMAVSTEQAASQEYDIVICSQVLEHVPFPLLFLKKILSTIPSAPLLYLEIPHEPLIREHPGQLDLAHRKKHWHEHINFFTETSLRRLSEQAGLEVIALNFFSHTTESRKGEILGLLAKPRT